MSRRIKIDEYNGEADLPPATRAYFEALMQRDPLLAADILQDLSGVFANLYDRALERMRAHYVEVRRAAFASAPPAPAPGEKP